MIRIALFITSAATMAFELAGARLLAPYLGTSVDVWACIIAAILGGLSLGYWLGGQLADRHPERRYLAGIIVLAAIAIFVTRLISHMVLSAVGELTVPLTIAALGAGFILFVPASMLLGAVSPFATKLSLTELRDSAKTVGNLSAISTIGSIVGTIVTGSWLLSYIGTTRLLDSVAIVLVLISFLVVTRWNNIPRTIAIVVIATASITGMGNGKTALAEADTLYNHIRVIQDPFGGERSIVTDPFGTQCAAAVTDGGKTTTELIIPYVAFFDVAFDLKPEAQNTLVIGGCNYSYPRHLLEVRSGTVDVFELDPGMTRIAREWFGLQDDPRLTIKHGDARTSFTKTDKKYDAIFVDAYNAQVSIPWQLTTKEALQNMSDVLNDDGIIAINVVATLDTTGNDFLKAEYATARAAFPDVRIYQVQPLDSSMVQNWILTASKKELATTEMTDRLRQQLQGDNLALLEDGLVLTDDFAPVEHLTTGVRATLRK